MCLLCARIFVHRERPQYNLFPGQKDSENFIQWARPCAKPNAFEGLTRGQTDKHYGLQTYLGKCNTDQGGFLDIKKNMKVSVLSHLTPTMGGKRIGGIQ